MAVHYYVKIEMHPYKYGMNLACQCRKAHYPDGTLFSPIDILLEILSRWCYIVS